MNTQVGFALRGRNPDVLTCIANLSNDEVFTPPEFANRMLDTLAIVWATDHGGANIWAVNGGRNPGHCGGVKPGQCGRGGGRSRSAPIGSAVASERPAGLGVVVGGQTVPGPAGEASG